MDGYVKEIALILHKMCSFTKKCVIYTHSEVCIFTHRVFFTQCVILHSVQFYTMCNFTHSVKFYTQCVILHTSLILHTSVISHTRVILHTNIILHTSVILHTCLILHTEWNSTHTVKFYTHSVMLLLRTVYNFTQSV